MAPLPRQVPGIRETIGADGSLRSGQRRPTLRFLKLNHGPALDEPELWSVEACAEELGVPASQLEAIMRQVGTWVEPQVRSDPEWRALKRSALQVGAEVVGREHAAEFAKPRGFSHTEFSDEVRDAVFHSVRVAQRNGAREVLLAHLCQASYEVATTTAECSPAPSIPFSTEAVNAVARAMELGRDDGDVVELRHLRAACGC